MCSAAKPRQHADAAVVDWFSRRVPAWKLSITMEAAFCIETLEEALSGNEKPEIFNTDQGSQFTSAAFTARLKQEGIRIGMDGKGRWRDNVFVERIWKSIKYEQVYLHAYASVSEAGTSIGRYLDFYNSIRPHSSLKALTPDQVYFNRLPEPMAAQKQKLPLKEKAKTVRTNGTTSVRVALPTCTKTVRSLSASAVHWRFIAR